jgi:hypothetical protein
LLSLYSDSKESGNQFDLPFHIAFCHPLYLSLPDHEHDTKRAGCIDHQALWSCRLRTFERIHSRSISFPHIFCNTTHCDGIDGILPLLYRSPEMVEAALVQARTLFPFPILGIDTDNGKEFVRRVGAYEIPVEHGRGRERNL